MNSPLRFTVSEFYDLVSDGTFLERRGLRLELIEGEIREIPRLTWAQSEVSERLDEWSIINAPAESVTVRSRESIILSSLDSVPEVDLAWVRRKRYAHRLPSGEETYLVVEVADDGADCSVAFDRREKGRLYSRAHINEYWLVNIPDKRLEVNRSPQDGYYASCTSLRRGDVISPEAFPQVKLKVAELFEDV